MGPRDRIHHNNASIRLRIFLDEFGIKSIEL